MSSATAVLACILGLLGRDGSRMPPIELVGSPPPGVSTRAEAFIRHGSGTIYLITSSAAFREAASTKPICENQNIPSLRKLASVLVHEEWHIRNGADERGAYQAQLMALLRLGVGADSSVFGGVKRSMLEVLRAQERAKRPVLLATLE